jgi:hypothetical protein
MLGDRRWPAWHPQHELGANDLLGLEQYLLARGNLAEEDACGVSMLSWPHSLQMTWAADHLAITAGRLKGVTPAGDPVVVEAALSTRLGGFDNQTVEALRQAEIDIWVDVNARATTADDGVEATSHGDAPLKPDGTPERPLPEKLQLSAAFATGKARIRPLRRKDPAEARPHSLYLGRYRCADQLELVDPPFVRCLGALEPRNTSEAWKTWIEPFRERLDTLAAQVLGASGESLMAQELLRVGFEWPALPIPALARRLAFIKWLDDRRGGLPAPDFAAALRPLDCSDLTGADLPRALADLLPVAVRTSPRPAREPAQPSPTPSSDSVGRLIGALAAHRINYHAPLEALQDWRAQMAGLQDTRIDNATAEALFAALPQTVNGLDASVGQSVWVQSVILLTAACIEASAIAVAPNSLLNAFNGVPGATATAKASAVLSTLYAGEARERQAGPIAFHALAQAAGSVKTLQPSAKDSVAPYFRRLAEGRLSSGARSAIGAQNNRAFDYLNRVLSAGGAPLQARALDAAPWDAAPLPPRQNRPQPTDAGALGDPIAITLIGPEGGGKSALLHRLCRDMATAAQACGVVIDGQPAESGGGLRVTGALTPPSGRSRPFHIQEIPLTASGARGADLTILAIDPATIDAGPAQLEPLHAAIDQALDQGGRIAIAYTKADEYGVVTPPDHLRIVKREHAVLMPQLEKDIAWETLVRVRNSGVVKLSYVNLGAQGPAGGEIAPTRAWVLGQTRPLWERLSAHRGGGGLTNAYFVSAAPLDPRFDRPADRGLLQLLVDFSHVFSRGTP